MRSIWARLLDSWAELGRFNQLGLAFLGAVLVLVVFLILA